jgi:hypothetical protein
MGNNFHATFSLIGLAALLAAHPPAARADLAATVNAIRAEGCDGHSSRNRRCAPTRP